jgi:hypothetical protein
MWYLDDGTLVGDIPSLRECMRFLQPRLAAVGSDIDLAKTQLWGPGVPERQVLDILAQDDPIFWIPIASFYSASGVLVSGSPISRPGSIQFTRDCAESSFTKNDAVCLLLPSFRTLRYNTASNITVWMHTG